MIPFLLMWPLLIDQIEQVTVGPPVEITIISGLTERQHAPGPAIAVKKGLDVRTNGVAA